MPRSRKYWTERKGMLATFGWIWLLGVVISLVSCSSQQPLTAQQELAMIQQEPQAHEGVDKQGNSRKQTLEEHFSRLEQHAPLLSQEAEPPEAKQGKGGKYRSMASFDLKHVAYLLGMQRKINTAFTVPPFVPDHGAVSVPVVGFTVRRNGELVGAVLLRSSGYPTVDHALLKAVKRAAPYHPFPDDLPDQEISVRIYANLK